MPPALTSHPHQRLDRAEASPPQAGCGLRRAREGRLSDIPAQESRMGRNHLSHYHCVTQGDRRRDSNLLRGSASTVPSGEPLYVAVARLCEMSGSIKRSAIPNIPLANSMTAYLHSILRMAGGRICFYSFSTGSHRGLSLDCLLGQPENARDRHSYLTRSPGEGRT